MDALEFNKLAAGLLVALLLAVGIGKLADLLYAPRLPGHAAAPAPEAGQAATQAAAPIEALPLANRLAMADLAAGEGQFRKCRSCHIAEAGGTNRTGPHLWGIVGDGKARDGDFAYSAALAGLGGSWTFEALDAFLAAPASYAAGTKMTFRGLADAQGRADLVAWLNTRSDSPLTLPEAEALPQIDGEEGEEAPAEDAATADEEAGAEMAAAAAAEPVEDAAAGIRAAIAAASPADGERAARKCKSCHTLERDAAHRVGPNLWDMVANDIAAAQGYRYSSAMAALEGSWSYERLWRYLADPRGEVPGTRMGFRGISDEGELAALIAYLRSLSDAPAPLAAGE